MARKQMKKSMNTFWIQFFLPNLASDVFGVIVGVILEDFITDIKDHFVVRTKRLFRKRRKFVKDPETVSFGKHKTTWLVVDGDGESEYSSETIRSHIDPHPLELPEDLAKRRLAIHEEQEHKRLIGEHFHWNGDLIYLDRITIHRSRTEEYLALDLWFRPSDYFTFLATNMALEDESVRAKYLQNVDWYSPVKYFSSSFGINLAVLTCDDYLILSQRSKLVGSLAGDYHISVNEGLSGPLDRSTHNQAPDVYRCASRGLTEELGLISPHDFDIADCIFLSVGVDIHLQQWGLLGMIKIKRTADEVSKGRAVGVKDKWENHSLFFIKFDLRTVVDFILNHEPWTPAGLTCLYHLLIHEFSYENVDKAIRKRSKNQG